MYYVYVLYSSKFNKIYIGQTTDLANRLQEHNTEGLSSNSYTKKFKPWEIVYTEEFPTRGEALIREKQLKSQKGREFIWNIIKNNIQEGLQVRSVG
jgi:putative endonuclease